MNSEISILIPTCNRPGALAVCLHALKATSAAIGECIVCDDSSDTQTREMLAADFPWVRRMEGPHRGPGANRNAAAREAAGRWLVFIDDDCIPRAGFLDAYKQAILEAGEENVAVLSGQTVASGGIPGSLLWEAPAYSGRGLPPSCNFAIRREAFQSGPGFDERYRVSFEDIEFFARIEAEGFTIRHVSSAVVEHPRRRIPSPRSLAARWEARVISTLDLGAPPRKVAFLVLRHVTAVIVSRFRENPLRWDMLAAAAWFSMEWVLVALQLPFWIRKWAGCPRSPFWVEKAEAGLIPSRYGL